MEIVFAVLKQLKKCFRNKSKKLILAELLLQKYYVVKIYITSFHQFHSVLEKS